MKSFLLTLSFTLSATILSAVDQPLRDGSITVVDGTYYLTGTLGSEDKTGAIDFNYNAGVALWRSADGQTWKSLGLVWDRAERFQKLGRRAGKWKEWNPPSEQIDALLTNASTTPSIHRHKGDWYLLLSQNQHSTFILKSESGKPEGPYADHAHLATGGGYPSLFTDDDGSVYLVLAEGWIAPMKPDLSGLAKPIQRVETDLAADGSGWMFPGERGVSLFKRDGNYHLLAARWGVRDGQAAHDAHLWIADAINGPYRRSGAVLPDTGPARAFQLPDGRWFAVASTPVEEQPRILPVPSTR